MGIIKIAELGTSFTWLVSLIKSTFWDGTVGMFMGEKRLFVSKMDSTIDMQKRPNDYLYNTPL